MKNWAPEGKRNRGQELYRKTGRRWVLPLGMRLLPLRGTEQIVGDKPMVLFSQSRAKTDDDDERSN